jgi:hypothetical protein
LSLRSCLFCLHISLLLSTILHTVSLLFSTTDKILFLSLSLYLLYTISLANHLACTTRRTHTLTKFNHLHPGACCTEVSDTSSWMIISAFTGSKVPTDSLQQKNYKNVIFTTKKSPTIFFLHSTSTTLLCEILIHLVLDYSSSLPPLFLNP